MKNPLLFERKRECVICACAVPLNNRWTGNRPQPSMLSLNVTVYRRTRAGRQLATSKGIHVCEECLVRICSSRTARMSTDAAKLAVAIFNRVADRYNAMLEAKSA